MFKNKNIFAHYRLTPICCPLLAWPLAQIGCPFYGCAIPLPFPIHIEHAHVLTSIIIIHCLAIQYFDRSLDAFTASTVLDFANEN